MKTLTDLKRDLVIGKALILTSRYGQTEGKNIGEVRYIVKKNTVGFYLNPDKSATKGSFVDRPKASLLEYETRKNELQRQAEEYRLIKSLGKPQSWTRNLLTSVGKLMMESGQHLVSRNQTTQTASC